jgi:hypothetical protein
VCNKQNKKSANEISMYKYITRMKDKHRCATHEFQVKPEIHMLRYACKTTQGILFMLLQPLQSLYCLKIIYPDGVFFCSFDLEFI